MKKLELKTRKWVRNLLAGFSLTAVAFIFQACYGIKRDFGYDILLSGSVKSKTTNLPIKGIKVSQIGGTTYGVTDENGNFSFHTYIEDRNQVVRIYNDIDSVYTDSIIAKPDSIPILFADIDGVENGYFVDKILVINPAQKNEVRINVELEEQ